MKNTKQQQELGAAPAATPKVYSGNVMSINTQTKSGSEYILVMVRSKTEANGESVDINETPVGLFMDPGTLEGALDANENQVGIGVGDLVSFVSTGMYEGKTSLGDKPVFKASNFEAESLTVVLKKRTYADESPVQKTGGGVALALKDVAATLADFLRR